MTGDPIIDIALYALAALCAGIIILGILLFIGVLVIGTIFNGDSNYPWEEKPHWNDPSDE